MTKAANMGASAPAALPELVEAPTPTKASAHAKAPDPVKPPKRRSFFMELDAYLLAIHPDTDRNTALPWRRKRLRTESQASSSNAAPSTSSESAATKTSAPINRPDKRQSTAASSAASASAVGSAASIVPLPDLSRNGYVERAKGKWECARTEARTAPATNLFLAAELDKLGAIYESQVCTACTQAHAPPRRFLLVLAPAHPKADFPGCHCTGRRAARS